MTEFACFSLLPFLVLLFLVVVYGCVFFESGVLLIGLVECWLIRRVFVWLNWLNGFSCLVVKFVLNREFVGVVVFVLSWWLSYM